MKKRKVKAGCFAVVSSSILLGIDIDRKPAGGEILGALACFIPIGLATAWMLRKLPLFVSHQIDQLHFGD
jgi:hypothetical protein